MPCLAPSHLLAFLLDFSHLEQNCSQCGPGFKCLFFTSSLKDLKQVTSSLVHSGASTMRSAGESTIEKMMHTNDSLPASTFSTQDRPQGFKVNKEAALSASAKPGRPGKFPSSSFLLLELAVTPNPQDWFYETQEHPGALQPSRFSQKECPQGCCSQHRSLQGWL